MSLKRDVLANYIGQSWAALMGIAFVPLYVSILGIGTYGLVGVFTVLQAWLTLFDMGLTPTLNREMARLRAGLHSAESIRDLLRSLEILFLGLAFVLIGIVWLVAKFIVDDWLQKGSMQTDELIESIRIMGIVLALKWLEQIYRASLQGLKDQVWLNTTQAIMATVRWGGAYLVMVVVAPTINVFFIWQGAVSLITLVMLLIRVYIVLPTPARVGHFDMEMLKSIKSFAGGMFLTSIMTFALTQSDKIVIGKLMPLEQLGYYMLAAALSGGLVQLVTPMNNAIYPHLTEYASQEKGEELVKIYNQASEWMALIIVPSSLLLCLFAEPVLILWTGDYELAHNVKYILSVMALGTLFNGLMNLPYMLQLAHGWTSLTVIANAIAVTLYIPVTIYAVQALEALGAAIAWFILNIIYLAIVGRIIYKKLLPESKWKWFRQAGLIPIGACLISGSVLNSFVPATLSRNGVMTILLIAGTVLFITALAVLPHARQSILWYLKIGVKN